MMPWSCGEIIELRVLELGKSGARLTCNLLVTHSNVIPVPNPTRNYRARL